MSLCKYSIIEFVGRFDDQISEECILDLTCDAVDALQQIHEAGILHWDLKPENIMFSEDDKLQLIDFSYSKVLNETGEADTPANSAFEGTIYFWARTSPDSQGNYSGHTLPMHDLESLIFLMTSICQYSLPWDEELIGREIADVHEYLQFKSQVSDDKIVNLLPNWFIKAFKYLMTTKDTGSLDYDRFKSCLKTPDKSQGGMINDQVIHYRDSLSMKVCPIRLLKINSEIENPEDEDCTKTNIDDSCHAYDPSEHKSITEHMYFNHSKISKQDLSFGAKVNIVESRFSNFMMTIPMKNPFTSSFEDVPKENMGLLSKYPAADLPLAPS